jgi:alkaline phosphatase D
MADLRQYRDQQPASPVDTTTIDDPGRTLLGHIQERWLHDGLTRATTTWKLLGSSVMLTPVTFGGVQHLPGVPDTLDPVLVPIVDRAVTGLTGGAVPATGVPLNVDAWDGYGADQAALLDLLAREETTGFVSLVGDIHSAWACELQPAGAATPVGVELVCSSITSDNVDDIVTEEVAGAVGLPASLTPAAVGTVGAVAAETALVATNPDVRMVELRGHGYSILELTPGAAQMDWWEVDPHVRDAGTRWARSWRTRLGTNQLAAAAGPVDPWWRPPAMATGSAPATTATARPVALAGGAALAGLLALRTRRSSALTSEDV